MVCFFTWLSLLFCSLFPTLRVKPALPPLGSWIADVIERGLGHLLSLVEISGIRMFKVVKDDLLVCLYPFEITCSSLNILGP